VPDLPREHSRRRFKFSRQWIVASIFLVLTGCASQAPILSPSPSPETLHSQGSSALTVFLTPVDTSGFASDVKAQYGFDVSFHFTAFELQLVNRSNQPVRFESQKIYLTDARGKSQQALTEEESIDYYRYGDLGPDGAVVLLSKPVTIMRTEIEQIRRLHIQSATLLPGETHRGMVLFKKIDRDQCHNMHVQIQGITFTEAAGSKDVDIAFTCENQ
jgi:hypothetical protein